MRFILAWVVVALAGCLYSPEREGANMVEPGIVDFLIPSIPIQFVADNTVAQVTAAPAGGLESLLQNMGGLSEFQFGDSVALEAVYITPPYSYGFSTGFRLLLDHNDPGGGNPQPIPQFSQSLFTSGFEWPMVCQVDLDIFLPAPTGPGNYTFSIPDIFTMGISQINGPAILQGQTLDVNMVFQVRHTKEMQ